MHYDTFIEIDQFNYPKVNCSVAGDVALIKKVGDNRVVSILCDGLGSGIEANVLASFTASMGIEYMVDNIDIRRTAELVMDALPLCPDRKVSYSTFTIADISFDRETQLIEHGNPRCLVFRKELPITPECAELHHERWKERVLNYSHFKAEIGDRIILLSDGVTQAGIGTPEWPMGLGIEAVTEYISKILHLQPEISAHELSRHICTISLDNDMNIAGDDISCVVIYLRHPRIMRVLTGPPMDPRRDTEYANLLRRRQGSCAVCGGTTANIIERELHRNAVMDFDTIDPDVPATSTMKGIDLVTEGCITLSFCAGLLEHKSSFDQARRNGATMLRDLFLRNDIIEFYVGTRVNQAHQDPDLPVELDIRRNLIRKICGMLENNYHKKTVIRFF